jgi:hypothetical protein
MAPSTAAARASLVMLGLTEAEHLDKQSARLLGRRTRGCKDRLRKSARSASTATGPVPWHCAKSGATRRALVC